MKLRNQMRKGSTELLLLTLLAEEPMYGYQISQELARRSDGYFDMKEGLLYPTLHRMQKRGLLSSAWRQQESSRRRKYYTLTLQGRTQLKKQTQEWQRFISHMEALLKNT